MMAFADRFNEYVKTQNPENAWRIIQEDFSKNVLQKQPMTGCTIRILAEHSKHVAQLLVKEKDRVLSSATCFLLTGSLGLTCYHVVEDVLVSRGYRIDISFDYDEMGAEKHYIPAEVVSYSEKYDYAFLRVKTSPFPGGPEGLLQHLALPPQDGAVAIIGHPQGQCKQTCVCSVINLNNHIDSSDLSFVHVLSLNSFLNLLSSKLVKNNTCPYEGASGAPMFNERGELVAMHLGGDTVDAPDTTKTVIEYGRSIVEIVIMGAVEIEDLGCRILKLVQRNEDLQRYLSSGFHAPHMKNFITGLLQLGEVERPQIFLDELIQKYQDMNQIDFETEDPKITERMVDQCSPKPISMNELENKEDKDERLRLKLSLEFTICSDNDLRNVLLPNSNYLTQSASVLGKLLLPSLHCEKTDKPGCYKCEEETCKVCDYMKEGTTFSSYETKEKHNIGQLIDCNDKYVIYLISCTKCRLQYVGCTVGKLRDRILRHITDVPNPKNSSRVSKHFHNYHLGDLQSLQFQGIQIIRNPWEYENGKHTLVNVETAWIWRLKTAHPYGLNLKIGSVRHHCEGSRG